MEKVKLGQKKHILSLSAILWLPLCYSHSADALASVDESEVRGDKDFSGLLIPRKGDGVTVELFNLVGKGVAVTTWDYG